MLDSVASGPEELAVDINYVLAELTKEIDLVIAIKKRRREGGGFETCPRECLQDVAR